MLPPPLCACILAFPVALAPAVFGRSTAGEDEPSDARLERAWKRLDDAEREELIEWFSAEVRWIGTFQMELVQHTLKDPERDPFRWPELAPAPVFEAAAHAPGARKRRMQKESSSSVKRVRERFLGAVPERGLEVAWVYDWVSREPRLVADPAEPERLFRNALRGHPPLLDYAEVLVTARLDDGARAAAAAAFGHAYADRDGRVFPGITLYDAWGSAATFETPDVECLGIVHTLLDEWTRWRAPVPSGQQASLYATIEEQFVALKRHRGLRTALARTYLLGSAVQRDGYDGSLGEFHALWEAHASDPARLADILPDADGWGRWLDRTSERVRADEDLWKRGQARWATLDANAAAVRASLVRVLRESGAL